MRNQSAFTLLEFIITCSIVAVCALCAFHSKSTPHKLLESAKEVERFLRLAWIRALADESDLQVALTARELKRLGPANEIEKLSLPPLITLKATSQLLNFYASGVASPTSFTLNQGSQICYFNISLRGRIRHDCA